MYFGCPDCFQDPQALCSWVAAACSALAPSEKTHPGVLEYVSCGFSHCLTISGAVSQLLRHFGDLKQKHAPGFLEHVSYRFIQFSLILGPPSGTGTEWCRRRRRWRRRLSPCSSILCPLGNLKSLHMWDFETHGCECFRYIRNNQLCSKHFEHNLPNTLSPGLKLKQPRKQLEHAFLEHTFTTTWTLVEHLSLEQTSQTQPFVILILLHDTLEHTSQHTPEQGRTPKHTQTLRHGRFSHTPKPSSTQPTHPWAHCNITSKLQHTLLEILLGTRCLQTECDHKS